ncbi:tRNA sulfurtransferase, partial [Acidianus sp. RZ1]|uniref:tRNA sulfurtransferase n=1 Tax=Acidianus sp. RZ1 TaxID=1540082 RepID=UPI00179C1CC4|nr:tRNA 4-thiouridine(8) synthase ThiI [Acidianus sp. RZ1]
SEKVGEKLANYGRVFLENPDISLHIEIRDNSAFFFDEILEGPGGLPLMAEGKALALISGGIDSPVAAWMIMKRGVAVDFMYCNITGPIGEKEVQEVVNRIGQWSIGYTSHFYSINCLKIAEVISSNISKRLQSIAFKRALYRIGQELAKKVNAGAIVTGESLAQVSSQTLSSLRSLSFGMDTLILRPLIGFDKLEIIKLAEKIGTFEASIKVPEYCSMFSHHPKTKVKLEDIKEIDKQLDDVINNVILQINSKMD